MSAYRDGSLCSRTPTSLPGRSVVTCGMMKKCSRSASSPGNDKVIGARPPVSYGRTVLTGSTLCQTGLRGNP